MSIRMTRFLFLLLLVSLVGLTGCNSDSGSTAPQALVSPARLASVGSGADSVVVTDFSESKFCQVDMSTLAVTTCFSAKGQPSGIAYADYNGGRYFVGNRSVRSVDIFDAQGNFLGHLGGKTGLFDLVNDLAVYEPDEFIYVLDSKNARIDVYNFEGNLLLSDFTSGGLTNPSAIEVDSFGSVYVSDYGTGDDFTDQAIRIFNSSGTPTGTINSGGGSFSAPSFSAPQGLFVDGSGNIFLVDSGMGLVYVYDAALNPVKSIGERGVDTGQVFYPLDVFVDAATDDVFVTDNRNGRVTVYRGEGVVP